MIDTSRVVKLKNIIKEELKNDALDLITRQSGQKIFLRLEKENREAEDSQTICLDFKGVGVIDYSCADEVIAKLVCRLQSNEYGQKYIVLLNLTPTQKENIHVALERKNLALLGLGEKEKPWEIVGIIDAYLLKTLEMVMKRKQMHSSELAAILKLELNTASMRLINLHKLRLVKKIPEESRERGRRHFVYRSLLA